MLLVSNSTSAQENNQFDWCFMKNSGQYINQVNYGHAIPNGHLFLQDNQLTYHLINYDDLENESDVLNHHAFNVKFLNSNLSVELEEFEQTSQYFNYFISDDASKWASEVYGHQKVKYNSIYNGIDFIMYDYNSSLKYDFIVKPGSNPNQIKLEYEGLDNISIDSEGKLHLENSISIIIEDKPFVYQMIDGKKVEIESNYKLDGNILSFEFPKGYNSKYELVIDPTLIMSTYSGATSLFSSNCSAYDQAGNIYAAGISPFMNTFPTTVGAYQTTTIGFGGLGAVQKFAPNGTLLYATYLGGDDDYPLDITINNDDNLVLAFNTNGAFPITVGTFDPNFNGGAWDYAVAILNNNGTNLLASTYLGGSGIEGAGNSESYSMGLFIDNTNNILLTGSSASIDFPTTGGVLQPAMNGVEDGIIVKFNSDLTNLDWATYLGGADSDIVNSIKIAPNNDIYVVGNTLSNDFPASFGSINAGQIGGRDGFVARINANGTALLAASYLGTATNDRAKFIEINDANEVFVGGTTVGIYPISAGVFSSPSDNNLFVHKMSTDLTATLFSTSIGCSNVAQPEIYMTAFGIDYCDKVYFTGASTGNNFPLSPDAYTTNEKGLYMCVLNPDALSLDYATYFGGDVSGQHFHPCSKSKYNREGILYHTECTNSSNYPILSGANSTTGVQNDGATFIFDFEFSLPLTQISLGGPINTCNFPIVLNAEDPANVNVEYIWDDNSTNSTLNVNAPGTYSVKVHNTCDTIYETVIITTSSVTPQFSVDLNNGCKGTAFTFTNNTLPLSGIWEWDFGDGVISNQINPIHEYEEAGEYIVSLKVTNNGCENTIVNPTLIKIYDDPIADFSYTPELITIENTVVSFINETTDADVSYEWDFGADIGIIILENPVVTFPDDNNNYYPVTLTATNQFNCSSDTTKYIHILDVINFYVPNAFTPENSGTNDKFTPIITSGVEPYQYRLTLYNRLGEIVFESYNFDIGWDGKYDNKVVQTGVYIWQIEFKETMTDKKHTHRGHVTVLR